MQTMHDGFMGTSSQDHNCITAQFSEVRPLTHSLATFSNYPNISELNKGRSYALAVWLAPNAVAAQEKYCMNQASALQLGTMSLTQCMAECDSRSGSADVLRKLLNAFPAIPWPTFEHTLPSSVQPMYS